MINANFPNTDRLIACIDNFYKHAENNSKETLELQRLIANASYHVPNRNTVDADLKQVKEYINNGADVTKPLLNGTSILTKVIDKIEYTEFDYNLFNILLTKGAKPDDAVYAMILEKLQTQNPPQDRVTLKFLENVAKVFERLQSGNIRIPEDVLLAFEDKLEKLPKIDAGFNQRLPMQDWLNQYRKQQTQKIPPPPTPAEITDMYKNLGARNAQDNKDKVDTEGNKEKKETKGNKPT